jgi:hypothetical protein
MIEIKVTAEGGAIGPKVGAALEQQRLRIQAAIDRATGKLANSILEKGRADISSAGKFGSRWTSGLTAGIAGGGNVRTVTLRQSQPHWQVFQFGAIIKAKKNLLWIPLPGVSPTERGDFFGTSKKGNRLLFRKDGPKQITPLRVGKESVRIPKKFHLVEIARAEAKTFGALYRREME